MTKILEQCSLWEFSLWSTFLKLISLAQYQKENSLSLNKEIKICKFVNDFERFQKVMVPNISLVVNVYTPPMFLRPSNSQNPPLNS